MLTTDNPTLETFKWLCEQLPDRRLDYDKAFHVAMEAFDSLIGPDDRDAPSRTILKRHPCWLTLHMAGLATQALDLLRARPAMTTDGTPIVFKSGSATKGDMAVLTAEAERGYDPDKMVERDRPRGAPDMRGILS